MTSPEPNLSTLSDAELNEHLLAAEADEASIKTAIKKLKNELLSRNADIIKSMYAKKPEPFGIVNLAIGGKTIKIDTPKKVEWEQNQLEKLWNQISSDGADPKQYIKVEYKVSESLYKTWGDNIKSYFAPARTVKSGNPSIEITEIKE